MNYDVNGFLSSIENRKDELFHLLLGMLQIDSQSFSDGTGNEEAFAEHLANLFRELGVEPDIFSPLSAGIETHEDYYPGRHLEHRNNCVALFPGLDHSKRIMLAAHEDTVIIGRKESWTVNPFGEIKNGRIYGRGACDDKYALAACVFIMKLLKENGIVLPYDVVVAGFSDEENGGSNGALAACLKYPCDEAIMLDGHNLELTAGGAGGGIVKVSMSCDKPLSSCEIMFDAFQVLRDEFKSFAAKRRDEFKTKPYFADTDVPDTTVRFTDVRAGWDGSAMNHLEALITFYTTSDEKAIRAEWEAIKTRMNEKLKEKQIHVDSFDMITRFFHYTETSNNNKALMHMADILEKYLGIHRIPSGMCLSDYPMFTYYATPNAFGMGSGRNFSCDGGAHQRDEFIECSDLTAFTKAIAAFLLTYQMESE